MTQPRAKYVPLAAAVGAAIGGYWALRKGRPRGVRGCGQPVPPRQPDSRRFRHAAQQLSRRPTWAYDFLAALIQYP